MENVDETIARVSKSLASSICAMLSEFGADIPLKEAQEASSQWLQSIYYNDPDEFHNITNSEEAISNLATAISLTIVTDIAEERPGTNPWIHDRNVPLPLTLAYSQLRILASITDLAINNSDNRWAENANANVIALSGILSQHKQSTKATNENILWVPQPAMAYIARFMRNTVAKLERDNWITPTYGFFANSTNTLDAILQHADILEKLTATFGRPVNPYDGDDN